MKGRRNQTEIKIKEILALERESPEEKSEKICDFMNFKREEVIRIIKEIGTQNEKKRSEIIRRLWKRKRK